MIRTFRDADTEALFLGRRVRRWTSIETVAMLNRAARIVDLRIPPGNRLEALKHERAGQYSIRINDQYRVCFVWRNGDAHDVEIVDYH